MRSNLGRYATLVFDCDGVVLNSNSIKTTAFYKATLSYGEAAAQAMVDYHVANGGVSRYRKFAYFLEHIAPHYANEKMSSLEELLRGYSSYVLEGLLSCEIAPGLAELREQTRGCRWLIVSGGDQSELRDVFERRDIAQWFDGGIYGSPDTKECILAREMQEGNIKVPGLFIGDSKYDFKAATSVGLDFVFVSKWTEVVGWEGWISSEGIIAINSVGDLCGMQSGVRQ